MRSWKELQAMLAGDVRQVRFQDVEELGFACGHLTRQSVAGTTSRRARTS